jgi:hypothetical protein
MAFGDLDDPESSVSKFLAGKQAEPFEPEKGTKPGIMYLGLPKPHLAGTVIFGDKEECAKGVSVTLTSPDGSKTATQTDSFGDFAFDPLERVKYIIQFEAAGYGSQSMDVELTADEHYLGEVILKPA